MGCLFYHEYISELISVAGFLSYFPASFCMQKDIERARHRKLASVGLLLKCPTAAGSESKPGLGEQRKRDQIRGLPSLTWESQLALWAPGFDLNQSRLFWSLGGDSQ